MCSTTDIKDHRLLVINNIPCKLISSRELRGREFFEEELKGGRKEERIWRLLCV